MRCSCLLGLCRACRSEAILVLIVLGNMHPLQKQAQRSKLQASCRCPSSLCNPTPSAYGWPKFEPGRLIASHVLRVLVTHAPPLALQGAGCRRSSWPGRPDPRSAAIVLVQVPQDLSGLQWPSILTVRLLEFMQLQACASQEQ